MEQVDAYIMKAIQERFKDIAEEEIIKCEKNMRLRIGEYASSVAVNLMERISIDKTGRDITIRIDMPKN